MEKTENQDLHEFLDPKTEGELNYLLSRYCGPHDLFLFGKNYGDQFKISQNKFRQEIKRRLFNSLMDEALSDQ